MILLMNLKIMDFNCDYNSINNDFNIKIAKTNLSYQIVFANEYSDVQFDVE